MNLDVVAVNVKTCDVYDFLADGETRERLLERANGYRLQEIETYERLVKDYPDREDFKNQLKRWKNAEYQVMSYDEFQVLEKKNYTGGPVKEITKEEWEYALNVLPPLKWCTINGVEMFCMSEMYTGTYTTQYARVGEKYYAMMVDCVDKSTWIHNYL